MMKHCCYILVSYSLLSRPPLRKKKHSCSVDHNDSDYHLGLHDPLAAFCRTLSSTLISCKSGISYTRLLTVVPIAKIQNPNQINIPCYVNEIENNPTWKGKSKEAISPSNSLYSFIFHFVLVPFGALPV